MTSTGRPPSLRPLWSSPSSKALRISLPIAATGPLKVLMNPILIVFCCGMAGEAVMISSAAVASKAFLMWVSLRRYCCEVEHNLIGSVHCPKALGGVAFGPARLVVVLSCLAGSPAVEELGARALGFERHQHA